MKHPNITYMELTVDNVEITCNTIRHIQVAQCPKCFKIWRTTLTDGHWTRKEK